MPVKRIIKRIMDFLTSRLERKLLLIFFSVLLAVGIPAALIELRNAEREVYQLNERRWDLYREAIYKAIETIMLEGRADLATSVINRFKEMKDVIDLDIARMDGSKAYTGESIKIIEPPIIDRLKKEGTLNLYEELGNRKVMVHLGLLLNKKECARCHGSESPYRGIVIIKTSLQPVEVELSSLLKRIIFTGALFIVALSLILSLVIRRMVERPLHGVLSIAQEISRGDLTKEIKYTSRDEVGGLINSIEEMRKALGILVRGIKDSSLSVKNSVDRFTGEIREFIASAEKQVEESLGISGSVYDINTLIEEITESIKRLHNSIEETSTALLEMKASIKEIAESVASFAQFIDDTSASIEESFASLRAIKEGIDGSKGAVEATLTATTELNESIKEVKRSASQSASIAGEVATSIKDRGLVAIEETIRAMEEITLSASHTREVIEETRRSSERIDEIVKIIDGIADSTRLLALNAAILAAQAGEYGKGFGVVADEIGRLAENTAGHTKEVASIIAEIKEDIGKAANAQEKTEGLIKKGHELLTQAGTVFNSILKTSTESASLALFIEKATEEQAKAIQEINSSMESIFHRMEEIAKASEEQRAGSEQILRGVERMKEIAGGLKNSVIDQSKGADMIAGAGEAILEQVSRIRKVIEELKIGGEEILKRIGGINEIARRNYKLAGELEEEVPKIGRVIETLQMNVNRFRIDHHGQGDQRS
jgi:methyl-accepting chemotaxis protein